MYAKFITATIALFAGLVSATAGASVTVSADGSTHPYLLFYDSFGGSIGNPAGSSVEVPDNCGVHNGAHISYKWDYTLDTYVFLFHSHLAEDTLDCTTGKSDRQRTEVKTGPSGGWHLKGQHGNMHNYRWKFRLTSDFQPSTAFTHIFQIKAAAGSDSSKPIFTLTPRKTSSGDVLQVVHHPNGSTTNVLATIPLSQIRGEWIEGYVKSKYTDTGTLHVTLRRINDGATLLDWNDGSIDMWRSSGGYNYPKWGIYRSTVKASQLRTEHARFNDFCIGEGSSDICPSYFDPPLPPPPPPSCPYYDPERGVWISCP